MMGGSLAAWQESFRNPYPPNQDSIFRKRSIEDAFIIFVLQANLSDMNRVVAGVEQPGS